MSFDIAKYSYHLINQNDIRFFRSLLLNIKKQREAENMQILTIIDTFTKFKENNVQKSPKIRCYCSENKKSLWQVISERHTVLVEMTMFATK